MAKKKARKPNWRVLYTFPSDTFRVEISGSKVVFGNTISKNVGLVGTEDECFLFFPKDEKTNAKRK